MNRRFSIGNHLFVLSLGFLVAGASSFFPVSSALADFILVNTSNGYAWDRPTLPGGNATFQAWETFTSTTGPNAPQTVEGIDLPPNGMSIGAANTGKGFGGPTGTIWNPVNAAGLANVFESVDAANVFLTSGGNIYSPSLSLFPRFTIPNNIDGIPGNQLNGLTSIVLQLRTIGTIPNLNSFLLTDPISGTQIGPSSPVLNIGSVTINGGPGGTLAYNDYLVRFEAFGNADLYTIDFASSGSSMSLDRVAVDTYFNPSVNVPEPGTISLFTCGLLLSMHRRRKPASS